MTAFENQGVSAVSCEPFAEWCDSNGIILSASRILYNAQKQEREVWNDVLKKTQEGNLMAAEQSLATLDSISRQIA